MSGKAGYRRPPKHGQFQPGRSGNLRGRPKRKKLEGVDIVALLTEPIPIIKSGVPRTMNPFEASLRSLVKRGLVDDDFRSLSTFLDYCEQHGVIGRSAVPVPVFQTIFIPKTWDEREWQAMFDRYGAPPWPGKRSGLPGDPPKEPDGADDEN